MIKGSPLIFQRIMNLDHPHVIKMLEYVAGKYVSIQGGEELHCTFPYKLLLYFNLLM